MSFIKFSEFMDMIDRELKQKRQDNVVTSRDAARLAKQVEVAHWANQALGFLSGVNDSFWRHNQEYTPDFTSNKITLPFFWKRLDTIVINDTPYKVGLLTDLRYSIYSDMNNVLVRRGGTFDEGVPITFIGIFRPNRLPTNGTDEDLEAYIDIDPDWINLLKLSVLIKYSGKMQIPNPLWYGQYKDELEEFRKSGPAISVTHTWRNKIFWGEHF
jgi:hypothetical protein